MSALRWVVLCSFLVAAVSGCGKANSAAPVLNSNGKHPADWLTGHRAAYQQNRDQCRECHGMDLKGGVTRIDCFNQAGLGQCHSGGHGPGNVPHALPYKGGALHGAAAKADLIYCQSCHGTAGGAGSNPRFNIPLGSLTHGCEDCHRPFTAHPPTLSASSGWRGHATAGNMGSACTLCHGTGLSGGVGPGCSSCHTALVSGTIPTVGTCSSCHRAVPVSGSHSGHLALASVNNSCNVCHDGAGYGTVQHGNGTKDVQIAVAFNAKSGVATGNSDGSCSNVSCHGGVQTPSWGGGLSAGCSSCHLSGTSQYNSYYSGEHAEHLDRVGLQCTDCHDMNRTGGSSSHYGSLGTPVFELTPAATIRVPGYTAANPSCSPGVSPAPGTYSVAVCHTNKGWNGN